VDGVKNLPLHLGDDPLRALLIPVPIQLLGHISQLDHEVAGQVHGFNLAPLFFPKAEQGGGGPGVRLRKPPKQKR
jgi:hypothetical protein